ncbi:hypothetical protein UC8_35060 [Roseimaritima ulvae]|uniref:Uncharacterized protein n=2 Tax=Roseimaritima ulvae TaxID=980254 RepID=A0A5B9R5J2_9BACT|nr:hypothetical protein UC8_35060 [Roseimaritima ulvae]
MSKFDKQIAHLSGERTVAIEWRRGAEPDGQQLREMILGEIDAHQQIVPLDLRGVEGAPQELVELLLDCQSYAKTKEKSLRIMSALQPMRAALHPSRRYPKHRAKESPFESLKSADASQFAQTVLQAQHQEKHYDVSRAQKVTKAREKKQTKDKARPARTWKYYATLTLTVMVASCMIGAVEWVIVFAEEQTAPKVQAKSFEPSRVVQENQELRKRVLELERFLDENVADWRQSLP